jgi:hypothetical protein
MQSDSRFTESSGPRGEKRRHHVRFLPDFYACRCYTRFPNAKRGTFEPVIVEPVILEPAIDAIAAMLIEVAGKGQLGACRR